MRSLCGQIGKDLGISISSITTPRSDHNRYTNDLQTNACAPNRMYRLGSEGTHCSSHGNYKATMRKMNEGKLKGLDDVGTACKAHAPTPKPDTMATGGLLVRYLPPRLYPLLGRAAASFGIEALRCEVRMLRIPTTRLVKHSLLVHRLLHSTTSARRSTISLADASNIARL